MKKSLKEGFKDLFSRKKFGHGEAHYLGTSQPQGAAQPGPSRRPADAHRSRLTAEAPAQPQGRKQPLGAGGSSGGGAPSSRPAGGSPSAQGSASNPSRKGDYGVSPSWDLGRDGSAQPPNRDTPAADGVSKGASEELQVGIGLLVSDASNAQSAQVLRRVLRNILGNPSEQKYRRLRLDNPKIVENVVAVNGALDILRACGFEEQVMEGTERFMVMPESAELGPAREAVRLLDLHFPVPAPATGTAQPPPSQSSTPQPLAQPAARPRNTKLLLPRPTEADIPDWFFQRTGGEIRMQYLAAKKAREDSQVLMTKAYREQLQAAKRGPPPDHAVIRIRLPEGVLLQGEFGAREPLTSILEWVAEQARDPTRTFELYLPTRQVLPVVGLVKDADLMPTTLMNFRFSDEIRTPQHAPTVKDELLQAAEMDWKL